MKSLTAASILAVIRENKSTFKENATFTDVKLRRMFDIPKPTINKTDSFSTVASKVNSYQLRKTSAYTSLNKVLNQHGLCIAQVKGTRYRVLANDEAISKADSAVARAASCSTKAERITASVPRFSGYTPQRRFRLI